MTVRWGRLPRAVLEGFLMSLGFGLFVWTLVWLWAQTPVVYVSVTGECVRVLSPDDAHSCEHLPDRYETAYSW